MFGCPGSETRIRQQWTFYDCVSGCRKLLRFMAASVLVGSDQTEEAVRTRCGFTNPPAFKSEAAFHYWLNRILINEA